MQIFHQLIVQMIFLTGSIHSKVKNIHFFNKTILKIFYNYIPNKTILCDIKDPPWFSNKFEKILTKKNEIFEQYKANGKSQKEYERLQLIVIA